MFKVGHSVQWVIKAQKCDKKRSPTLLYVHHQPELLIQGRIDPSFTVVYTKSGPYHLNVAAETNGDVFIIFVCPILVSPCKLEPQFLVLSWEKWHPVCSSAVNQLLQNSTCCGFRDALLHILDATSGYLSCCWLPISCSEAQFELPWVALTTSTCLNPPTCCRVIG